MYYYALGYFYQHWLSWLVQISNNRVLKMRFLLK